MSCIFESNVKPKNPLFRAWQNAVRDVSPERLQSRQSRQFDGDGATASLFWGKAACEMALATLQSGASGGPALVIAPRAALDSLAGRKLPPWVRRVGAEHPIPGAGSFAAAAALLDFFDSLRRTGARELRISLSGGASSLAWLPPSSISEGELLRTLEALYRMGLPISELNRRRSRFCGLKSGGAARWLRRIAPAVRARVQLISDVAPYGPEVVGSGPFWDGEVRHHILADNSRFVRSFARELGDPARVLASGAGGEWTRWVARLSAAARVELARGARADRVLILGGEPLIRVPVTVPSAARGGRMTQIAAGLALELAPAVLQGRVEILAASSDGVDGRSGAAGALVGAREAERMGLGGERGTRALERAIGNFDSARALDGALIPARGSGTNVQDLVAVRVRAGSS